MILDDNEDSVDEEYEDDDEYYDEDEEVAYKIISGSESKVEKELNILSGAGWSIEKFDSFISNSNRYTSDEIYLKLEIYNEIK